MHRCVNIIPTMPGMPPIQCEEPSEFPGGMCDDCAFLTAHLITDGAELIGHHDFPLAICPHGTMVEGTLYVARKARPSLDEMLRGVS